MKIINLTKIWNLKKIINLTNRINLTKMINYKKILLKKNMGIQIWKKICPTKLKIMMTAKKCNFRE